MVRKLDIMATALIVAGWKHVHLVQGPEPIPRLDDATEAYRTLLLIVPLPSLKAVGGVDVVVVVVLFLDRMVLLLVRFPNPFVIVNRCIHFSIVDVD
jgi:hypothetical protein